VSREPITLGEVFQWFIRKHSKTGPEIGWLVLDVTPEECEQIGRDFVSLMAIWGAELHLKRSKESGVLPPDWPQPVRGVDEEEEKPLNETIH